MGLSAASRGRSGSSPTAFFQRRSHFVCLRVPVKLFGGNHSRPETVRAIQKVPTQGIPTLVPEVCMRVAQSLCPPLRYEDDRGLDCEAPPPEFLARKLAAIPMSMVHCMQRQTFRKFRLRTVTFGMIHLVEPKQPSWRIRPCVCSKKRREGFWRL